MFNFVMFHNFIEVYENGFILLRCLLKLKFHLNYNGKLFHLNEIEYYYVMLWFHGFV